MRTGTGRGPAPFRVGSLLFLAACSAGLAPGAVAVGCPASLLLSWQIGDMTTGLRCIKDQYLDRSIGQDTEHMGAVLRFGDGTLQFTHARGEPGRDEITIRIRRPAHVNGGIRRYRDSGSPAWLPRGTHPGERVPMHAGAVCTV